MEKYTFHFFQLEFEKTDTKINDLYNLLITLSPLQFTSFEDFDKSVELCVKKYIDFNDYLHSNNLLQYYKINCSKSNHLSSAWCKFYGIRVYSKRTVKYYLDNPSLFWGVIDELNKFSNNPKNEDFVPRMENLIIDTLDFYKSEYVKYPSFLANSLHTFVNYYRNIYGKSYSASVDAHIGELSTLIKTRNKKEVEDAYSKLESQNISIFVEEETPKAVKSFETLAKNLELAYTSEEKIDKFYGDISLTADDGNKKIMVIGGDPFLKNTSIIYGIGKRFNIQKDQFEIFNDYDKLTNIGKKVNNTQYNDKYIGIIFGSCPHSTSGNGDEYSLISKVEKGDGFPLCITCRSENGILKATKEKFTNGIIKILTNYKAMNDGKKKEN